MMGITGGESSVTGKDRFPTPGGSSESVILNDFPSYLSSEVSHFFFKIFPVFFSFSKDLEPGVDKRTIPQFLSKPG